MRYQLKQIHCRPWTLNGLSLKLIGSAANPDLAAAAARAPVVIEREACAFNPFAKQQNPIVIIFATSRTQPSTIAPTHPLFRAAVESSSPQIPERIDPPAAAISTSSGLHPSTAINSSS